MIVLLSAIVALAIVATVVLKGVLGWAGSISRTQRVGLCLTGAGLVWAGPARFLDQPPGLGDLLFVVGIAVHVIATHGPSLWMAVTDDDDDWPFD